MTGNRTPVAAHPPYVSSLAASMESVMLCHPSSANMAAGSELLGPSCWPMVPSFAPVGGASAWGRPYQDDHYILGVHAGVIPQTIFSSSGVLSNMSPTEYHKESMAGEAGTSDKSCSSSGGFSSARESELLETMVISDAPGLPPWGASSSESQAEYDGLPRINSASDEWLQSGASDETTVSPKMLRIRPTPTPTSSSESIRRSFLAGTADDSPPFPCTDGRRLQEVPRPAGPVRLAPKARKLLPDRSSHHRPILRSNENAATLALSTAAQRPISPSTSLIRKPGTPKPKHRFLPAPMQPHPLAPSTRMPEAPMLAGSCEVAASPAAKGGVLVDLERRSKDDFLVRHKQLGLTYKEIRRMGNFTEAESTLRGRYRTLTKSREARVRKPEWSEKDVSLTPA